MALKSIRAWLGIDAPDEPQFAPLRETLEALDHLEPPAARFLAAFAYLLGRVAHADLQVSTEETRTMEALVREQGQLSQDQAMVVVQLAKTSNLLFGGTANFLVAREFCELATYDQKLALMRCLFARSQQQTSRFRPPKKARFTASRQNCGLTRRISSRSACRTSGTCRAYLASNAAAFTDRFSLAAGEVGQTAPT